MSGTDRLRLNFRNEIYEVDWNEMKSISPLVKPIYNYE
jgi:hypothetical protein